jgi:hypothetical protein
MKTTAVSKNPRRTTICTFFILAIFAFGCTEKGDGFSNIDDTGAGIPDYYDMGAYEFHRP